MICVIIPNFQKHNVNVERYRLKKLYSIDGFSVL